MSTDDVLKTIDAEIAAVRARCVATKKWDEQMLRTANLHAKFVDLEHEKERLRLAEERRARDKEMLAIIEEALTKKTTRLDIGVPRTQVVLEADDGTVYVIPTNTAAPEWHVSHDFVRHLQPKEYTLVRGSQTIGAAVYTPLVA